MNTVMDTAIAELFQRLYRMPAGVSRKQFRRGMRRILIVQIAGNTLLFGFFALIEYVRSFA